MKDGCVSLQGTPAEVWAADPDLQITSRHLSEIASKSEAETVDEEAEKERQMLLKLVEEKMKEEEKGTLFFKFLSTGFVCSNRLWECFQHGVGF